MLLGHWGDPERPAPARVKGVRVNALPEIRNLPVDPPTEQEREKRQLTERCVRCVSCRHDLGFISIMALEVDNTTDLQHHNCHRDSHR